MKHLALLTLYADYQVLPAKERARDIYLYFSSSAFTKLHLEEMFHVGREELEETEQFWEDCDIVNIGLHFFLKNVRPYAASCSEA